MAEEAQTPEDRYEAALAELPAKQRKFVVEYLVDLHGQNAAIRAGYSAETARSQASRLLTNVNIRVAINAGMQAYAMPKPEILYRLAEQARGSMADFLRVDEEEVTLSWSLLTLPTTAEGDADMAGMMLKLASQENIQPTDRILQTATIKRAVARLDLLEAGRRGKLGLIKKYSLDDKGKVSIELYDAQNALALKAKFLGMGGDDGILKYIDLTKLTPEQLQRVADGENPLAVILSTTADPGQSPA
jgi:phage terminase small subunit